MQADNLFVWFIHLFCYLFVIYLSSHLHNYDYSASVQVDLCTDTPHFTIPISPIEH